MLLRIFIFLSLSIVVNGAVASKMQEAYLKQFDTIVTRQESSGELADPAKCLGIEAKDMASAFRTAAKTCIEKHIYDQLPTKEQEGQLDACMQALSIKEYKKLGISEADVQRCGEKDADQMESERDDKSLTIESEIDALMDKIGDRHPTAAEQAQIETLNEKRQQLVMSELDAYAEKMEKAAQGTEDSITLPYPTNSKIKAHHITGMNMGDVYSLPVAVLVSPDSPEKLLAFYKRALPKFKVFDLGDSTYILLEKDPGKPFNLFDFSVYLKQQHVLLNKDPNDAERQSLITIGYVSK